jgi:hypothetical protein
MGMNRDELLMHHDSICKQALELMKKKNHDYAGDSGKTPFAIFERCEAMGICTTEAGFLVRLTDKLSRLSTFAESGNLQVENEGYTDAIVDIINYCVLFSAYVKSKSV